MLLLQIDPKPCNPRTLSKPKRNNGYPKVFLGGLPSNVTETDLRQFFMRYGKVMEVVIMYDQEKKKSRGKCFRNFYSNFRFFLIFFFNCILLLKIIFLILIFGLWLSKKSRFKKLKLKFSCAFKGLDFCHLKMKTQLNAVWPTTLLISMESRFESFIIIFYCYKIVYF